MTPHLWHGSQNEPHLRLIWAEIDPQNPPSASSIDVAPPSHDSVQISTLLGRTPDGSDVIGVKGHDRSLPTGNRGTFLSLLLVPREVREKNEKTIAVSCQEQVGMAYCDSLG